MVQDLIEWAAGAGDALYLIVFLLVFGESAAFLDLFVPGEVGLVLGASAMRQRQGSLPLLVVVVTAGAVLGDSVSYWLGRRGGPAIADRWAFTRRHVAPALERARRRFEDGGGPAVFLARWVGALRAVVPLVAGAGGMSYPRFLAWSVPAAAAWATAVSCAGWYLGPSVASTIDRLGWWVSVLVVAGLAVWLWVRHRSRSQQAGRDQATAAG